MRAMREARYSEMSARSTAASRPSRPAVRPAQTQVAAANPVAPAAPTDELCGHRSMNGRTCTREHGHAARSHRYS
jgi:hypothetical protein